jgi:hypothetical protein
MKVKRLTKKQKLFWLDLQGRVGDHVVQYGRPEEIASMIGEELGRVDDNDELNKRVDQYLSTIMDRNFPPIDVACILRSWLTFYSLPIFIGKLTSYDRFMQRYSRYVKINARKIVNIDRYCSDNTLAQHISRRILK